MTHHWMTLAAAFLVLGCSTEPVRMPPMGSHTPPAGARTPYELTLDYSSDLADPYYVTSGPAESYARYAIATRFRNLLERQVAHLSTPGSPRKATLEVRVTGLATRYHQLGSAPPPAARPESRFASLGGFPAMIPARFASRIDDDGNSDIPEEIHKGATLTANISLRGDGIQPLQQIVTGQHDDVMLRWDYDRRWAYSYTQVLDRTLRAAADEIAGVLQAALR